MLSARQPGPHSSRQRQHLARGTRDRRPIVNFCRRPDHIALEQVSQKARPAGFKPATRCLEGTAGASRDVAWRRSTRHLTAIIVADCRTASRGVCLHWLTYWLTEIYLPSLMFEHTKTVSTKLYFDSRPLRPVIHLVTLRYLRPRDNARSPAAMHGCKLGAGQEAEDPELVHPYAR